MCLWTLFAKIEKAKKKEIVEKKRPQKKSANFKKLKIYTNKKSN